MERQLSNAMAYRNRKGKNIVLFMEKTRNANGEIEKNIIEESSPKFSFWITKPEYKLNKPVNFIEASKVDKIEVDYQKLHVELFNRRSATTDNDDEILREILNNNYKVLRNNHKDINFHFTDVDLSDYKIREYHERYANEIAILPLEKSFTDIEVDISEYFDFPEPEKAPCPICFISYFHEPTLTLKGYILIDEKNLSQTKFFNEIYSDEWIAEVLKENFPEAKTLELYAFEDELEMLESYFSMIHQEKPDFCCGWNFFFDMKTFEVRLRKLLAEREDPRTPADVMSDPQVTHPSVYIQEDVRNQEFSKKNSKFQITCFTQFVDLLFAYASIRIPLGKKDSYALEDITTEEVGEGKAELDGDIRTALRKNFVNFLIYGLTDSYRLWELERKNQDVDLLYNMGLLTYTRFTKVMSKTTSLRNFAAKLLFAENIILSNNKNTQRDQGEKKKFKGALVADPNLMDSVGIELNGILSNTIFENVIDEDLSSMYPSIILSTNIDSLTMIGKIVSQDDPELGEKIFTLLAEGDMGLVGKKLLNLPSADEVIENLEAYYA
jgi:DNA polymerase elongation subunit (family B)